MSITYNRTVKSTTKLSILLLLVSLIGCDKEKDSIPTGIYLKRVIYHQNADQIRYYHYNNSGRLSSREYKFDNTTIDKFDYQYDNNLVDRINYYTIQSNTDHTLIQKNYVEYDYEANKIVKSTLLPENSVVTYVYDLNNRVIQVNKASSIVKYEYDNLGNIKKATHFNDGIEEAKSCYEYDDKKNPFFRVDPIHEKYTEIDLIGYACPNNLIKYTYIQANLDTLMNSEYIFKYDNNKMPVESYEIYTSKSNGYDRDTMNLRLYEYEIQ
ncbi:hypothetical protein GXP67_23775 [Rhodocytophaga rosea]|uniref:RHS repeat protein n=1 Tax=Rhodocytophaga rosea TaxID=2704465 RepID=A0A6C0GNM1_9BACT|nr:hypothetical protein [Rhodocytophaga rosea]QHT69444.1 hypothetical protein GXP67_23775 [Rhodocytophaga rosea]